jgi:hypothetical protein
MEAKWPFFALTFALLIGVGCLIVSMDRVQVMNQWTERRCEIPIMFAGAFFKPEDDIRSAFTFASDNFEFCMKSSVDKFVAIMMAPVTALFGKQVAVAGSTMNMMTTVRTIAQTMFNAFSVYLNQFFRRFNASVFEISKVMQFLRMAVGRISGIMMSMVYSGITLFTSMINAIQFIIKVVLIICGIMLVILIILFFILFPVMPIILYALAVVVSGALQLAGYMSPATVAEANDKKSGFCFAEWTMIVIQKDGQSVSIPITDVVVGDQLSDGSYITAIIEMDGTDVHLYEIQSGMGQSVFVSGSHLIKGTDHVWKSVTMDKRAVKTSRTSSTVYCFNTTSNVITIDDLHFRDWEELANDDEKGQMVWNYKVSAILNYGMPYASWSANMKNYVNIAVMSPTTLVKTSTGFIPIHTIHIGDSVVDQHGIPKKVLGCIRGEVEYDKEKTASVWKTELYEYHQQVWIKGNTTLYPGVDKTEGCALITEHGECIILDSLHQSELRVRDFTEVGYNRIYETYPYVDARLRIKE